MLAYFRNCVRDLNLRARAARGAVGEQEAYWRL